MADWSKLPYDIIHTVSTYLTSIEDFLQFSAVCSSWRSVYLAKQWRPHPQVPLLMFSDGENSTSRSFFSLYRNKVYNFNLPKASSKRCWGSSSGWLVTIGNDRKIHLLNPFTRASVSLPPISSLQMFSDGILDWYDIIEKAFVFKKPSTSDTNEEDLVVMIIYCLFKKLAFCRPGYSSWKCIKNTCGVGFIDVACVKDQIIAVNDMGLLVAIDIDSQVHMNIISLSPPRDIVMSLIRGDQEKLFFVESSGDLWMVYRVDTGKGRRSSAESVGFLIYTFDFSELQWSELSNLGNHTVFVGHNYSTAVCVADYLNCESNSVYFVRTRTRQRWPNREVDVHLGVHSMASGITKPLCFAPDAPVSFPLWLTPTLL